MRFRLLFTQKRPRTLMKTETFETVSKVERLENAPFLVWIGGNGSFQKTAPKIAVVSISVSGRFGVHDRRKRIETYQRGQVKTKRERQYSKKYFASFSLRRKRILLKTHLIMWYGPYFLCLPTIDISEAFLLTSGNVEREKLSETFPDRMFQCYFQDLE